MSEEISMMRNATLQRQSDDGKQSLGIFSFIKDDGELFVAKSLELGWHNNEHNISCIPVGVYLCIYTRSNRLSKVSLENWIKKYPRTEPPDEIKNIYTYEVMNVSDREGIRIHSANSFFELLGCIALGNGMKDINLDREIDITHSGETIANLVRLINKEDFELRII